VETVKQVVAERREGNESKKDLYIRLTIKESNYKFGTQLGKKDLKILPDLL